jgi:DNA-binding transcriptional LysR family regulator
MLNEIDLSRADLNLLVLFDVVMAERNVGRTAEQLHLSPSAVSHGLSRLRRLFNDPLFLRTPKGVAPTTRATELAVPIADILARVKSVMSIAEPFDPVTSSRRFMIGAPDGVSAIFLTPLLTELNKAAPKIDLGVRQLLPTEGESSPDRAWRTAFTDLDARVMDIAILPTDDIAARFLSKTLYEFEKILKSE